MDEVRVLAPATVSNVVCGFDCLGFALDAPCDEMRVRKIAHQTVQIVHLDDHGLPTEPQNNVAGVAALALLEAAKPGFGFEITIRKNIKPGSGIGSSAASACGAVVAANHLLGGRFSELDVLEFAIAGEMLASGSRHADNLAPCMYGGFTLVRSTDPLDIIKLDFPDLFATVIHPQIEIKTWEARALLPRMVPLADAIKNWSNLGAFVAGLAQGDRELMARSMLDTIVEPVRRRMIPSFDEVISASLEAGALGGGISGSGPSIFMLSRDRETADKVGDVMSTVYSRTGIKFFTYVSAVSPAGVRVV